MKPVSSTMRNVEGSVGFSRQIQDMFSAIAPRYDFLNRLLSFGRDRYWRKSAVDLLAPEAGDRILDVATGTADMALEIASRDIPGVHITGVDFSRRMLDLGRNKVRRQRREHVVSFHIGSGESLPFADKSFDGAVCAFGIRNYADVKLGLREIHRTLKPGGNAVILEFALPSNPVLRCIYEGYFDLVLPKVGNLISGHAEAYSYLPESVADFPNPAEFARWMEAAGFGNAGYKELTFGIVALHHGHKI